MKMPTPIQVSPTRILPDQDITNNELGNAAAIVVDFSITALPGVPACNADEDCRRGEHRFQSSRTIRNSQI
jgi:hypothetical protein